MRISRVTVAFGVAVVALNGFCGAIEEATYAKAFDRASGLLPGRSDIVANLKDIGAWTCEGGRRVDIVDGVAVEAEKDRVEIAWKGTFSVLLPQMPITLEATMRAAVPVKVMFYVFDGSRYDQVGKPVDVKANAAGPISFTAPPPSPKKAKKKFEGFKLIIEGEGLAGTRIAFSQARLTASYFEGYFCRAVDIPAGEIWEAVAEVGNCDVLYVNGRRVDDATVIRPRPLPVRGGPMYGSRRVSLKAFLKPGRNILIIHRVPSPRAAPAAYLQGSVVMNSGERILLDTDANWVWSASAPKSWENVAFDDSNWRRPRPIADMPRELGKGSEYKGNEAVSVAVSGLGLNFRPCGDRPCYDGLIALRNPTDNKLFFSDTAPFRLEAIIPPGFKDRSPELAWEISRYTEDNTFVQVARGRVAEFKPRDNALVAMIASNALPRGVYALTCRLFIANRLIEERTPETMVVTGKVKMPSCAGDSLEQGMKLTEEQTIDFTNTNDSRPWFETDCKGPTPSRDAKWGAEHYHTLNAPLIVERNGLKYRTTRPINKAQFSYKVEFARPGDWYLLSLEYPDDSERWIGVSCNADSRVPVARRGVKPETLICLASKCGPAIWTGGKYPNTGKMLEMKWLYRPDPGAHAINVMSLMDGAAAAAARLRVFHIDGPLPELDAGATPIRDQRRFGMLTERTHGWANGIYNLFSSFAKGTVGTHCDEGATQNGNPIAESCEVLRLMEDAASHYAEYMRFTGQNLHTMGCFQYSDNNTPSKHSPGDPRVIVNPKEMLARVLQANDLLFYASVEFTSTAAFGADRREEWFFANRKGERQEASWAGLPLNLNFLNPDVERVMLGLARELAEQYKDQSNFLGINWTALPSGFWIPSYRTYSYPRDTNADPLGNGYDDLTVGLFAGDTGVKVPGDAADSGRFEKRYQFLNSKETKPRWLAWRSQKMVEFFEKMKRTIREVRSDLEVVAGCNLLTGDIREWKTQRASFQEYLNSWGWAPKAFADAKGIWLMPWLSLAARYEPANKCPEYAMAWQANRDIDFYRAYADLDRRAIMLCAGWVEIELVAANFPYMEGWPRPYQQTMMAQQREEMAMEPYTQAMIGFDPQMVMMGFTDVSPYIGVEETQRRFARVLRRLPWGKFEPALGTGFDTNLAVRELRQGDTCYFYVANPGYWPIRGSATLEGAVRVTDIVSGKELPMRGAAVNVALGPYAIAAFSAIGKAPRVVAWDTESVSDEDLAHIRSLLEKAKIAIANPDMAEFLGRNDYSVLSDGAAKIAKALAERRYAAAWDAATDAAFWTVLFQKAEDIKYIEFMRKRAMTAALVDETLEPAIDGVLDDRVWTDAITTPTGPFVIKTKAYSTLKTVARVAATEKKLFIALELFDPAPKRIRGTTNPENVRDTIWGSMDDLVAFFVMPNDTEYYQFAVTANNALFSQQNRIRNSMTTANNDYAPKWKAVAKKHPWGWAVEVELDAMDAFGTRVSEAAVWKMNFHRQFRSRQHPIASWSYNSGDWHALEYMGTMRFAKKQEK